MGDYGLSGALWVMLIVGALLGVGAYEGCGCVYRHVHVSWGEEKP